MLALALIASLVAGQTGVCKPGAACQSYSHKSTAPTGQNSYTMNEGGRFCLNPAWKTAAVNPDAGADLITNRFCDAYGEYTSATQVLTVLTDGGMSLPAGVVTAPTFTATAASGVAGFQMGPMARLGITGQTSYYIRANTNSNGFDFAGVLLGNGYGWSSSVASGSNAYQVNTNGARVDFGAGASDYASSDGTTVTFAGPLTSSGNVTGQSVIVANGALYIAGGSSMKTTTAGYPLLVDDAEGVRIAGVATASLVALDGGMAGTLQYDTTTHKMTLVENNTRNTIYTGSDTSSGSFAGVCFGVCPEIDGANNYFAGGYRNRTRAAGINAVTCSAGTAGTGGTTGIVISVYDKTAGSEECTCTVSGTTGCTAAAGVPWGCDCTGTITADSEYIIGIGSGTDCSLNPANIVCNVAFAQ